MSRRQLHISLDMPPALTEMGRWKDPAGPPRLVVLSGAGLSVESGLSLFRDTHGLWATYDVNQVCNIRTWKANITQVHAFFNAYRGLVHVANPHRGHQALAELEHQGAVLLTQNVDNLLERAGARHVIHLHGRSEDIQCTGCGSAWSITTTGAWDPATDRCKVCGSEAVKPGVVFFHEQAPMYALMDHLMSGLRSQDVVLVLGTSGEVVNLPQSYPGCRAQRWLANLEPRADLPEGWFDRTWYAPITQSIDAIVAAWLSHQVT